MRRIGCNMGEVGFLCPKVGPLRRLNIKGRTFSVKLKVGPWGFVLKVGPLAYKLKVGPWGFVLKVGPWSA